MERKHFLLFATFLCGVAVTLAQGRGGNSNIPVTRFTCQGRAAGYYADVETGCQVYHMCDGLGRQFSYTCPNTTLFQQRMLICDHWYMVNCSKSESDYDANLLIGQRDKPFVSEAEMQLRTPRPDILSVPPNSNYYDGLREAETKFPVHPGNSIVGIADSISSANNNGLDSAKQNYRPPTSWSTGTGKQTNRPNIDKPNSNQNIANQDNLTGAASQEPSPTFQPTPNDKFIQSTRRPIVTVPDQNLSPPLKPVTTTEPPLGSDEYNLDIRGKNTEDPVYNFIKRFDPNSPDSHQTAMSKTEILDINKQLPAGQSSAEEERTPRKNNNFGNNGNNFNRVQEPKTKVNQPTKVNINVKPATEPAVNRSPTTNQIPQPNRVLVPPKTDFSEQPSTTMGPPIYYEWKWAVPAFDLEPPKEGNSTNSTDVPQGKTVVGRSPFSSVTRPTPKEIDPTPSNTEYNISSYFVPDYVFPLDKAHPGYEDEGAQTSFQVKVARPGRSSFGENPSCPQCHPAYLVPGTCEPCIVER